MTANYPARYMDRRGEERTAIRNDGKSLTMIVRGVAFQGNDWDSLEPLDPLSLTEQQFTLLHGCLACCTIEAEIPIPVAIGETIEIGVLVVELELGEPLPGKLLEQNTLRLCLKLASQVWSSAAHSGWFEGELLDLQRQLPEGTLIKACINCAFSDYSPYGHAMFGGLACFRDNKAAYRTVSSKSAMFRVWGTLTEFVQETHLCPEFEKRMPGTGYRG